MYNNCFWRVYLNVISDDKLRSSTTSVRWSDCNRKQTRQCISVRHTSTCCISAGATITKFPIILIYRPYYYSRCKNNRCVATITHMSWCSCKCNLWRCSYFYNYGSRYRTTIGSNSSNSSSIHTYGSIHMGRCRPRKRRCTIAEVPYMTSYSMWVRHYRSCWLCSFGIGAKSYCQWHTTFVGRSSCIKV